MKKNLLKVLAALAAILVLAMGSVSAEAPRDTLVWAMSAEPVSLDPMNTASMNTFTITYALYDCLTELGATEILLTHVPEAADGFDRVYRVMCAAERGNPALQIKTEEA